MIGFLIGLSLGLIVIHLEKWINNEIRESEQEREYERRALRDKVKILESRNK